MPATNSGGSASVANLAAALLTPQVSTITAIAAHSKG